MPEAPFEALEGFEADVLLVLFPDQLHNSVCLSADTVLPHIETVYISLLGSRDACHQSEISE